MGDGCYQPGARHASGTEIRPCNAGGVDSDRVGDNRTTGIAFEMRGARGSGWMRDPGRCRRRAAGSGLSFARGERERGREVEYEI